MSLNKITPLFLIFLFAPFLAKADTKDGYSRLLSHTVDYEVIAESVYAKVVETTLKSKNHLVEIELSERVQAYLLGEWGARNWPFIHIKIEIDAATTKQDHSMDNAIAEFRTITQVDEVKIKSDRGIVISGRIFSADQVLPFETRALRDFGFTVSKPAKLFFIMLTPDFQIQRLNITHEMDPNAAQMTAAF